MNELDEWGLDMHSWHLLSQVDRFCWYVLYCFCPRSKQFTEGPEKKCVDELKRIHFRFGFACVCVVVERQKYVCLNT